MSIIKWMWRSQIVNSGQKIWQMTIVTMGAVSEPPVRFSHGNTSGDGGATPKSHWALRLLGWLHADVSWPCWIGRTVLAVRLGNQSTDALTVHKQSWQSRCLFLQYYRGKKPFILRFRTARIKYRSYPARAQASSKKSPRRDEIWKADSRSVC